MTRTIPRRCVEDMDTTTSTIPQDGRTLGAPYRIFGRMVCRVLGWTPVGGLPEPNRAIFIASPHTSNWDGFIMQAVAWSLGVRLSWVTKHSLFKWPFRRALRALGAVPVDRSRRSDTVGQIARQITESEGMYLAIAPSGTRSRREHWKSGFYHMARAANVPVICGFLDFKRKRGGCGPVIHLTGDRSADMDKIRAFYNGIEGRHPELHTPVRLREESTEGSEASQAS
ncbi:MAG: lysophospholipid acyltransferase family protein [Myxococcota bacterium]|nr:lysophospholipid acyltransferase family protein [Myxococcota bacterium]